MKILKISTPKSDDIMNVEEKFPENGKPRVEGLVREKTLRELKTEGRLRAKYMDMDIQKIINLEIAELNKLKKEEKEAEKEIVKKGDACSWKPKSKSQLETISIRKEAAVLGVKLTDADVRLMKKEMKLQGKIGTKDQGFHYLKTMKERGVSKALCIILLEVIWIIKAKCPMPKNARAYQVKAVLLAQKQVDNVGGWFTIPFPGLTMMGSKCGLLLTAITNFEANNGSATIEDVEGAMAALKIFVDQLVNYVNSKCIANQTNALSIIASAGMEVTKEREKNQKPDFSIKQLEATGSILLTSLAGKFDGKRVGTTYYWQYGLKINNVWVWYDLPDTVDQCTTIATGMATDQSVGFRKATRTKKGGLSGWCPPLYISPK